MWARVEADENSRIRKVATEYIYDERLETDIEISSFDVSLRERMESVH